MLTDADAITPSAPQPELQPVPLATGPVRRFFRDADSAGNLEDGMEFHAAGVVIESAEDEITVLYLNPFTAKVEKRKRELSAVILYEFPEDDGVYWRLWEKTREKLESMMEKES
ncbi:MAG: hypothetical protein EOP88_28225 [Verrucomicrobiaceae bacterium]|nr:MAG: hypothetical protein EOP88_28225 [Verrucomicrobiaceae bacterium]